MSMKKNVSKAAVKKKIFDLLNATSGLPDIRSGRHRCGMVHRNALVLATSYKDVPRATALEFFNEGLILYILGGPGGKIANIRRNPRVSAFIYEQPLDHHNVQSSLQIFGRAGLITIRIVESIDNWQWDPFTKVNVKPGTDSLLFYITSWGITRSGWTFRTPSGQLTRLTSGGAGYGVWDKVSDSTCYIYVYNSRRYNLNNFTYLTISATDNFVDIKDSFSLNGKSTLVNSSAFSIDYGNTWTTFTKPSNLPPVYNLGFVKIDENTLALSDDNLNRIILVKDGTLYPTTLETPDIFNLKVFDGKYLWGIGLGGNVIRLEYANFDIITGISSEYNDKILVYPNPVIDNLKIEYSGDFDIKFEISNSVGQTVSYGKMFKNISIPISSFQSGIYIIKFNIGNKIEFRKFIKN